MLSVSKYVRNFLSVVRVFASERETIVLSIDSVSKYQRWNLELEYIRCTLIRNIVRSVSSVKPMQLITRRTRKEMVKYNIRSWVEILPFVLLRIN